MYIVQWTTGLKLVLTLFAFSMLSRAVHAAPMPGCVLYVMESTQPRLRVINLFTGIVSTLAGKGQLEIVSEDGLGTEAMFSNPYSLDVSPDGKQIYVQEFAYSYLRLIDASTGQVTSLHWKNGNGHVDGPIEQAELTPSGVSVSKDGSLLYVGEYDKQRIRVINLTAGVVSTLTGNGTVGVADGASKSAVQLPERCCIVT